MAEIVSRVPNPLAAATEPSAMGNIQLDGLANETLEAVPEGGKQEQSVHRHLWLPTETQSNPEPSFLFQWGWDCEWPHFGKMIDASDNIQRRPCLSRMLGYAAIFFQLDQIDTKVRYTPTALPFSLASLSCCPFPSQVPFPLIGYLATSVLTTFAMINYDAFDIPSAKSPWNNLTDTAVVIAVFFVLTLMGIPMLSGAHPRAKNYLMGIAVLWLGGMITVMFYRFKPFQSSDSSLDIAASLVVCLLRILALTFVLVVAGIFCCKKLLDSAGPRGEAAFALTYVVELLTPPPSQPGQPVVSGHSYEYVDLMWDAPRFKASRCCGYVILYVCYSTVQCCV
jgi:hypothetical protein